MLLNMKTKINEAKRMAKNILCDCKCKFDGTKSLIKHYANKHCGINEYLKNCNGYEVLHVS